MTQNHANYQIGGFVSPGFEGVYEAFAENFSDGKELGAALSIYHRGEKVVDLWGGYTDKRRQSHWQENTLALFFSATKGMASICIAHLHSQGKIDYDEKVSGYWPGFAKNGKQDITVGQLLSNQSGLCLLDRKINISDLGDAEFMALQLENSTPMWTPGDHSGYAAGLAGFYMSELIRRVDEKERTLGQYFQEEIAGPLGLEFFIGLPENIPDERISYIQLVNPIKRILTLGRVPRELRKTIAKPGSLFMKSVTQIKGYNVNKRETWTVEEPSGNGIGSARSVALLYGLLSISHPSTGIGSETMAELAAPALAPRYGSTDIVMGIPLYYRNGFMKNGPQASPFQNDSCFGFGGASGSMAFADPVNEIGYCYLPNKQGYDFPDGREARIQQALYASIEKLQENHDKNKGN